MGRLVCRGPPQHHHLGRQVRQLGHRHRSRVGKYDIYVLQATIQAEAESGWAVRHVDRSDETFEGRLVPSFRPRRDTGKVKT
jgi:hypothetical protein